MFHIAPRKIQIKDEIIVEALTGQGEIKRPVDSPIGQNTFNRVMSAWGFSYLSTILVSSMKIVVPEKIKFELDEFEFEQAKKDNNSNYYNHVVATSIKFKYPKSSESNFSSDPTTLLREVELKSFDPQTVLRPEMVTISFSIGEEDVPKLNIPVNIREEHEPYLIDQLLIYYWKEIVPAWNQTAKREMSQLTLFELESAVHDTVSVSKTKTK